MAKVPNDSRLEKQVAEDSEAISRLLTRWMGDVNFCLGNIALVENGGAQLQTFRISVPARQSGLLMCSYTKESGTSGTTADTIIDFGAVEYDNYSAVTVGASWHFTAPVGGKYLVTACVSLASPAAGHTLRVALIKNGTFHRRIGFSQVTSGTTTISVSGSVVVMLDAGDTIDLRQTSSASLSFDVGGRTYVQVTEVDTSIFTDPIPESCWPYEFQSNMKDRPKAVLVAEAFELSGNLPVQVGHPHWDWYISGGGRPVIQIRDVPGLAPGRDYQITVLVLKG